MSQWITWLGNSLFPCSLPYMSKVLRTKCTCMYFVLWMNSHIATCTLNNQVVVFYSTECTCMGNKIIILLLIFFVAGCLIQIIQIRINTEIIMVNQAFLIDFCYFYLLASQKKTAGKTAWLWLQEEKGTQRYSKNLLVMNVYTVYHTDCAHIKHEEKSSNDWYFTNTVIKTGFKQLDRAVA